ncbi:MAG: putative metal-binding motif-containing protein [Alphaproteobacteria bacterium]|nr:putative metal-binding motif-containing protein [Alphaproteobacteria bacterium]
MIECNGCHRHVRNSELACPFCGARMGSFANKVLTGLGASTLAMVLAACYGPPPDKGWETGVDSGVDADGDGFFLEDDCNDADATINPDATEVCDDAIDNDCDELVDGDDPDCAGG